MRKELPKVYEPQEVEACRACAGQRGAGEVDGEGSQAG